VDSAEASGVFEGPLKSSAPSDMVEEDGAELEAERGVWHWTAAGIDAGRDRGRPVAGDEYGVVPAGAGFGGLVGVAAEAERAVEVGVPRGEGIAAEADEVSSSADVREGGGVPG